MSSNIANSNYFWNLRATTNGNQVGSAGGTVMKGSNIFNYGFEIKLPSDKGYSVTYSFSYGYPAPNFAGIVSPINENMSPGNTYYCTISFP